MKKSPIFPKYETGDYNGHGFDPQVDFSQFLEEARKHASEKIQAPSQYPNEAGRRILGDEKKSKKSWKNSLFSWWKADKKIGTPMEHSSSPHISNSRRGPASGPIYGSGGLARSRRQVGHSTSGPLTGLFTPTRREGVGIPYMCLDQLNYPNGAQAYGPVYLVT